MLIKKFAAVLCAVTVSLAISYRAFAEELAVLQTSTTDNQINLFFTADSVTDEIGCKVSNTNADVVQSGSIEEKNIPVKTTMLIDVSKSIKGDIAEETLKYLHNAIEKLPSNEQMRIVTFGDDINELCDFTSDRYNLDKLADSIEFTKTQSRIYDAIYNTVPEMNDTDETCFYRTVVMTDGIDEIDSGITKEELYLMLQKATYPIDVISLGESEKKDLSALARISGGRNTKLYSGVDHSEIDSVLNISNIYWVCVNIPTELCDGSVRQFDISINGKTTQLDLKVPLTQNEIQSSEPEEESAISSFVNSVEISETDMSSSDSDNKLNIMVLIVIIIAIVVIVAAAAAIIIVLNLKKKNITYQPSPMPPVQDDDDKTQMLISDNDSPSSSPFEETTHIIFTDSEKSDQKWQFSLNRTTVITIGRDKTCNVVINDMSVSHKQFKVYLDDNDGIIIENISKSNITKLNGNKVISPTKITNNSTIEIGRIKLIFNSDNGRSYMF